MSRVQKEERVDTAHSRHSSWPLSQDMRFLLTRWTVWYQKTTGTILNKHPIHQKCLTIWYWGDNLFFLFFIGLMCVSVHIKVYKYIFLINVLYFLAWTKYLERHSWIHTAFLGFTCCIYLRLHLLCCVIALVLILSFGIVSLLSPSRAFRSGGHFPIRPAVILVGACFKIVHWATFCCYTGDVKRSWACGLWMYHILTENYAWTGLSDIDQL